MSWEEGDLFRVGFKGSQEENRNPFYFFWGGVFPFYFIFFGGGGGPNLDAYLAPSLPSPVLVGLMSSGNLMLSKREIVSQLGA